MVALHRLMGLGVLLGTYATSGCSLVVDPQPPGPNLDDWSYRSPVALATGELTEELSDIPIAVLVPVTEDMESDGRDLRFTTNSGRPLEHEIEPVGDGQTLIAWIKVPKLSASTEPLWMYFGNSEAFAIESQGEVWSNGFAGVWHLDETSTGAASDYLDSRPPRSNARGVAGSEGLPQPTVGILGGAQSLDAGSYISAANSDELSITGDELTLEVWVDYPAELPDVPDQDVAGLISKGGYRDGYRLMLQTRSRVSFQITGETYGLTTPVNSATPAAWHYIVARYDGQEMEVLIDATEAGKAPRTGAIDPSDEEVRFGRGESSRYFLTGFIDEVRISNVARSDDWIEIQHSSMLGTLAEIGDPIPN